jgi:hypothetical protein
METIKVFFIILTGVWALANFYIFVILPEQVKKDHYQHLDFENLVNCINKANSKDQIKLCCSAVYHFEKRNKHADDIEQQIDELIDRIEYKWSEIKMSKKSLKK